MEDNHFINNAGLSFADIRYNLINYLKNQEEFSDYNFEGSNLTVLLDILAYNAAQQGFYNTMVANEMFIDRASKRSSVVSLAKLVGYTPVSKKAAKAKVLLTIDAENVAEGMYLPRGAVFTGKQETTEYSFSATQSYGLYPYTFKTTTDPDSCEAGDILTYAIGPVELIQGVYNTKSFNIDKSDAVLLLDDKNIDKDSIKVVVMESITDRSGINIPWESSTDVTILNDKSKIFFLEENDFGYYTIRFGDDIIGRTVKTGNIVVIEYLTSSGQEANNIGTGDSLTKRSFSLPSNEDFTVITLEPSNGGRERENINTIRKNAVLNFTARNRAVTVKDYEGILLGEFNNNVAVRCWGGEENDPPFYGKVFASIRPIGTTIVSREEKDNISRNVLGKKNIVGIGLTFVDPEVLYVLLDVDVFYDRTHTNVSEATIRKDIRSGLIYYFRKNLVEFGDSVFAQDIETEIKRSNSSIKATDVSIHLQRKVEPTLGVAERLSLDFQNSLHHPYDGYISILTSSNFFIDGSLVNHYIIDDGFGKLKLMKKLNGVESVVNSSYGTIDYKTGKLTIPEFKVFSLATGKTSVDFVAKPENSNIFSKQNVILEFDSLDNNSLNINVKEVKTQKIGTGTVISK